MARLGRQEIVNGNLEWVGVSTSDVAKAIGASQDNIGYIGTYPNINKWSEFKALDDPRVTPLYRADFKDYKQGSVSKPFGLLMPKPDVGEFNTTLQAAMGDVEHLVVDNLNKESVWEYAQPQKTNDIIGYIGENPIYSLANDCFTRIDDFAGYEHNAEPLFDVKWDIIEGSIKCVITLGSIDGGITLDDMGLNGGAINLIAISKNKISIKNGGEDYRYVIGINDATFMYEVLSDQKKEYTFVLQAWRIDPILNDMVLFIAVTNTPIRYDLKADKVQNGIYVNPDGFKKDNVYYYPIAKNYADINELCVVENSFFEVKMNGGIGNVLWSQSTNGMDSEGNAKSYSKLIYEGYESPDKGEYMELNNNIERFDVKITKLGYEDSKSALRKFSISNRRGSSSGQYLYEYEVPDGDTPSRKALLCNLPMLGGTYKSASFYIEFEGNSVVNLKKKLIVRFESLLTTDVVYKVLSEDYAADSINYHSITFANVVDVYNNISGFEVKLNYSEAANNVSIVKTKTFTEWMVDNNNNHHFPFLPKLSMTANNEEIDNYGDIHFGLPEGISTSRTANGTFLASYEVIASNDKSSIGV